MSGDPGAIATSSGPAFAPSDSLISNRAMKTNGMVLPSTHLILSEASLDGGSGYLNRLCRELSAAGASVVKFGLSGA